ncbi:MAG: M55 family metallopeptidase [Candidatus Brocadiae bacterium]|nr:M55 family metallopeptidase [Candidatus Brocadiia bacterium]
MKIYMHTDLEGVSGLDDEEQMQFEKKDIYRQSCEKLMLDVNAAVAGAFDGGADHVAVADGHAGRSRLNFIMEMLDERAEYDERLNEKWWGLLDESYDGAYFVGAHAMAGTINGFLDHTQSSLTIYNWHINGRRVGELAQWATVAGAAGVPLLMVSGDEAACAEARAFFDPIETAPVKQGVGRSRAIAYPAEEARARIREAARNAIQLVGKAKPYKPIMPKEIKIEYTRSDHADAAARREGAERLDARTVRWVTSDPFRF